VNPTLADPVRDEHRCPDLLGSCSEDRKIRQPATIVRIEHQLGPQRLGPLDATGCFAIGTDEAGGHDAVDGKSLGTGTRIVPGVLVAIAPIFLLPPKPSLAVAVDQPFRPEEHLGDEEAVAFPFRQAEADEAPELLCQSRHTLAGWPLWDSLGQLVQPRRVVSERSLVEHHEPGTLIDGLPREPFHLLEIPLGLLGYCVELDQGDPPGSRG